MVDPGVCQKCGIRLPHDAPAGLCPSCLLAAAFASPVQDPGLDRFHSPTTPGPAGFVPPTPASLAPLFPQLDILDLLGHGGMGAVYKARQKKLDRFVALKIIRPQAAADPAFAERFNREARTLARLSHPHIVAVHDFGEVNAIEAGTPVSSAPVFYLLMEYVDGANLRQVMNGRRLQPSQALAIVPQVCEALQFAHDEGVIHRDIKPENILIDSKGHVKIADFGLAKLVAASAEEFTLTRTHQVMGTPRYMAPEQM
ncbi:MAG: serine/threonine protein kinase, partial [Fuerstia sp.]|nr:serine/threonine protein kinase [Fuerstiella sp.]